MRVLNVNSSLDPKIGGGTAERTFQMSRFLAGSNMQCTILTLDIGLEEARIVEAAPARVVAVPCIWDRFYVPGINWRVVRQLVSDADIVHLMGHWGILNAIVYYAARRVGKPYAVCPAGALPLFGRSRWFKRLYNFIVGHAIIRNASAWIAVTESELPHFESYGIPSSHVTVIPNGVTAHDFPAVDRKAFLSRHGLPDAPFILFMGRLNPIKGPDLLLEAFFLVAHSLPDYHLVFAGPDGGMLSLLQEQVEAKKLSGRVHFLGYVDGEYKSGVYRLASLLVVPSRQEAMSIVALEAGICGTPVLLTDQCGFSEVRLIDPRLEVPATISGIAEGLRCILADSTILNQIAPAWRNFVEQRYSWSAVGLRFLKLYSDILPRQFTK